VLEIEVGAERVAGGQTGLSLQPSVADPTQREEAGLGHLGSKFRSRNEIEAGEFNRRWWQWLF